MLLLFIEIKKEYVTVSSSYITFVPRFVKIGHPSGHKQHNMLLFLRSQDYIFRVEIRLWVCSTVSRGKRVFSSLKHVD